MTDQNPFFNIRYVAYNQQGELVESSLRMVGTSQLGAIKLAKNIYEKYREKYLIWISVAPKESMIFDKRARIFEAKNYEDHQVKEPVS